MPPWPERPFCACSGSPWQRPGPLNTLSQTQSHLVHFSTDLVLRFWFVTPTNIQHLNLNYNRNSFMWGLIFVFILGFRQNPKNWHWIWLLGRLIYKRAICSRIAPLWITTSTATNCSLIWRSHAKRHEAYGRHESTSTENRKLKSIPCRARMQKSHSCWPWTAYL